MDTFKAGVQYDDFTGTVAADRSDNVSLGNYLKKEGVIQSEDVIAALRIGSGENQGTDVTDVSLVVYVHDANQFDQQPSKVRAVECRMSPGKFLSFFKRFDLVMTSKGTDLMHAAVDGPHY